MSKDTSFGKVADDALKKQADQAQADAKIFSNVLDALKANKSIKLEPTTVGELSKQITDGFSTVFTGVGKDAMESAFAAAVGSSASGLAAMINKANARKQGTGAKKP